MEKGFTNYHPLVIFIYFCGAIILAFLSQNPIIVIEQLVVATVYIIYYKWIKELGYILIIMSFIGIFCIIINPLFVREGEVFLFDIMNKPIYLEPFIYGLTTFSIILTVTFIFFHITKVFDINKFCSLFSGKLPYITLLVVMIIRYIPMLKGRYIEIKMGKKGLCEYQNKSKKEKIKNYAEILNALINWSLESSINTADMMSSRGYGIKRRTNFNKRKTNKTEKIIISLMIIVILITIMFLTSNILQVSYYQKIEIAQVNTQGLIAIIIYGIFLLVPFILDMKDNIKIKKERKDDRNNQFRFYIPSVK